MTDTLPFRILMLLPDEDDTQLPENAAGILASSYYAFRDAGLEVSFASRCGGFSSISAAMRRPSDRPAINRLSADWYARDELADTIPLYKVFFEDFDVLVVFVTEQGAAQQDIVETVARFEQDGKQVVGPSLSEGDYLIWVHRIAESRGAETQSKPFGD